MASDTVTTGNTRTTQLLMGGGDTLTVQAGAFFNTADPLVLFDTTTATDAAINNFGSMASTGRAIRFNNFTAPMDVVITSTGTMLAGNDVLQLDDPVASGTLDISNSGQWESTGTGQAVDAANATGTLTVTITNIFGGTIRAQENDSLRIGNGVGNVSNNGIIDGGSDVAIFTLGADGIQYEDNGTGTVSNLATGAISGDRHGINAGVGSNITVTNAAGGTITGRNGSGVGSDGSATVNNAGTITGSFANNILSDEHGFNAPDVPDGTPDGDGDGIDIDGLAIIINSGTIQGTGAGGHGSDGRANTAEAIAAGGGTITNNVGGLITGQRGILVDDSSTGNSFFLTTIVNNAQITGTNFYAIRLISTFADTITNNGTITGNDPSGTAIFFGAGNNTLNVGTNSVINGVTDGEGGTNTLDYLNFGMAGVTVNLGTGAATGTGGVLNFLNVSGSAGVDNLTGNGGANTLTGRGGNDVLNGAAGNDIYVLGNEAMGVDTITDSAGIDTITSTVTRNLGFAVYSAIENLTLLGNVAGMVGTGNAGANRLDGTMSAVANTFRGLGGNDTYYLGGGDVADETAAGSAGTDSVFTNFSHGLGANLENLYLYGTAVGVNGNGNALANQMFGNLHTGANILRGLGGNDTYTIGGNDTVDETIGGSSGTDTVRASTSYTLGTNVENLFLLGTLGGMIGTGNALANGLDGTLSTSANSFRGLAGNDSYILGAGDVANESVAGSAGIDTVMSALTQILGANLENLTLTGGAVVNGTGNALANRIIGNAANNTLVGGALGDTLTGGLGKDTFKYNAAAESLAASRDTITDFQDGAGPLDVIDLTAIRPGPTATSLLTYIGAGPVTGAFQVGVQASGADVRVLVNLDGNFATAEMEILLTGTTLASMAAGDFLL